MLLGVLIACSALTVLLAGCTNDPGTAAPTAPGPVASAPISGSGVSDSPSPSATPKLTCDSMLIAGTVEQFAEVGWTSRQDPFYVDNIQLPGGIQCIWGDPEVPSDNVQVYGWAPVTADLAAQVTTELTGQGWKKTADGTATVFTPPENTPMGLAYRLSDGGISVSDTTQGLLLVEWPPAP